MAPRSRRSRLQLVNDDSAQTAGQEPAVAGEGLNPDDPVAKATHDVESARAALASAHGAHRVAQAKLEEAVEAAPKVHPVLAASRAACAAAQEAAAVKATAVAEARRAAADAHGSVRAAAAQLEDAETSSKTTAGQLVVAQVRVEKAERAAIAADEALVAAQEDAEHADAALGAAEQRVQAALEQPVGEHSSVIAAREKVAAAQRAVDQATTQVDAAAAALRTQVALRDEGESAGAPVAPVFASVDVFVERYVLPMYCHRMGRDTRWCAQWWRHAEAVTRFEALWEAFEVMRREPAPSLSTWIRDHFDHHLRFLTASDGVFSRCSTSPEDGVVHVPEEQWPVVAAPTEQFHRDPAARVQPLRDEEVTA